MYLKGSAKRKESSKTASEDLEKVSFCTRGEGWMYNGGNKEADLLAIENIIVLPKLANTKALVKAAVFVRLGEQPRCVHEVLA